MRSGAPVLSRNGSSPSNRILAGNCNNFGCSFVENTQEKIIYCSDYFNSFITSVRHGHGAKLSEL